MKKDITLGLSIAFSWAWASSLILGQSIALERGVVPFLIWAAANTATLALFGVLYKAGLFTAQIFKHKAFKGFAVVIQAFCLIINLNILNQLIGNYWLTTGIGLAFILLMYRRGLPTSILTDQWQGVLTFVTLLAIIATGALSGAPHNTHAVTSDGGVLWALWSACILLTSPFGDIQMWQRAQANGNGKGFWYASLFFGVYMALIFIMSLFQFNAAMKGLLLVACLAVTTSTIDSIAVAMHEVSSKRVGTALAAFLCVFWGVFKEMGIVELWSTIGVYRVAFCVSVFGAAVYLKTKGGRGHDEDTEDEGGGPQTA
ncbi:MAG: hypothetical protein ACI4RT_06715 [Candidatus Spyradenecus sp.]